MDTIFSTMPLLADAADKGWGPGEWTALRDYLYIASAILFIFGIKKLQNAKTAPYGNMLGSIAMGVAIVATAMPAAAAGTLAWGWVITALILGSAVGAYFAKTVAMTGMPEMVALFNGLGGAASMIVGLADFFEKSFQASEGNNPFALAKLDSYSAVFAQSGTSVWGFTVGLSILIGAVTLTGSVVAWGKLNGKIKKNLHIGQPAMLGFLAGLVVLVIIGSMYPGTTAWWVLLTIAALAFGVFATLPIGGGDMPVVISLLNSYSGLAACAAGFVLGNPILIVAGAMVGAAGLILTLQMCEAMNRSILNVVWPKAAHGKTEKGDAKQRPYTSWQPEDVAMALENADTVIFAPGYGMAVGQAQHAVFELGSLLEKAGKTVNYAIHPVAGRMPGHMNVLLAEANVPYEQLKEMDEINEEFATTDVVIVVGANDTVNPLARQEGNAISGMPILNCDKAHRTVVIKRSMGVGFAGLDNDLFYLENTSMCFGNAKDVVNKIVAAVKAWD